MTGLWLRYDACASCGTGAGMPCYIVRSGRGVRTVTTMTAARPHPGRLHLPGQGR